MIPKDKQGLIIGLCGRLGSGKKEIAQLLIDKGNFNCKQVQINETFDVGRFLDQLISQMSASGLPLEGLASYSDDALLRLQELIEEVHQLHLRPKASFEKLVSSLSYNGQHQILYPLTVESEFELLYHRNYFHLIAIHTPTQKRFENFSKKYSQFPITLELFCFIDDIISRRVQEFMYKARVSIENSGDQKDLTIQIFSKLQDIFRPIKPNWHEYFMHIAHIVKTRSNCMKRAVGVVIVKHDRVIATGYNGTPFGIKNCWENGCDRCNQNTKQGLDLERCFCFHAEESALLEVGISKSKGMVMYTTLFPCLQCTKLILATKIQHLYYEEDYASSAATSELHKYMKVERIDTTHYVY